MFHRWSGLLFLTLLAPLNAQNQVLTSDPDPADVARLQAFATGLSQVAISATLTNAGLSVQNRALLLTGQSIDIALSFRNPTSVSVEIPDPADPRSGGLEIWQKTNSPRDGYSHLGSGHDRSLQASSSSRTLRPTEELKLQYSSPQKLPNWPDPWLLQNQTPGYPGEYALVFNGQKLLSVDVISPTLVQLAEIPLTQPLTINGKTYPQFTYLLLLRNNDRYYVGISLDNHDRLSLLQGRTGLPLSPNDSQLVGPYEVLLTRQAAITSVAAVVDRSDLITVVVTNSDGSTLPIPLNSQRKVANPTPPPPPTLGISPVLECVKNNGNGSFNARFGYLNRNSTVVTVPVGTNNRFSPDPQDRGQVAAFQPGRIVWAFEVTWPGSGNLVWTLKGPDNQNRTATASSTSQACVP